jgi:membrane fusion protein (multidrug efflux system)
MLERKKVVSPAELALAKARLQKAKAEMDLAETHLQFSTVKAPFDGIMDRFHVRLGSLVEEGELLTFLSDNSSMWVYFNVSETDYLSYMEHKKNDKPMPAKLMLANGELFENEGEINTIEADFNNETGNVSFRATFPNPKGLLRHGETGTVLLAQTLKNALIIPQKATFEVLDKKFVYVVDKDGMLRTREIKVAQEVPHLFAIRNGLKDDDTILLEGLGKVHAGMHVEVQYQSPQAVLASLKLPLD